MFPASPYDAGDRRCRGSVETERRVLSQRQVALGMGHHRDVRPVLSQRLQDQGRRPVAVLSAGRRLVGLSARPGRSRLLRSQRLSVREHDRRRRPAPAAGRRAVLDYNKTIAVSPDATGGLGGEIKIDLNAINIAREEAAYQSSMANTLDEAYHLYNVCATGGTVIGGYRTGERTRSPALLLAGEQLPAARHRRRLRARVRAGLVAAQVRRSARRDLDAVRLRPPRRRDDGAQHRRHLQLRRRQLSLQLAPDPTISAAGRAARRDAPCRASASNTAIR